MVGAMPSTKHHNEIHHLSGSFLEGDRPERAARKWDAMVGHHVDVAQAGTKTRYVELRMTGGENTLSLKLNPDDAAFLAYALLNREMPNPAAYPELPATVPPTGPAPTPTIVAANGRWHCFRCGASGVCEESHHAKAKP